MVTKFFEDMKTYNIENLTREEYEEIVMALGCLHADLFRNGIDVSLIARIRAYVSNPETWVR